MRGAWACGLALLVLAGCTAITDAGEYKVDGDGLRDLQYAFKDMSAHGATPLDVAVVDANQVVQARARLILPPVVTGESYPDVELFMERALTPGDHSLYFYADTNDDNEIGRLVEGEHIWIEALDPDGVGEFSHSTMFVPFEEADLTYVGGDIVLEFSDLASGTDVQECLRNRVPEQVEEKLAVRGTLLSENRQVALFEMGPDVPIPRRVILEGIVDAGSEYRIDVLIDGERVQSLNRTGDPEVDGGDIVVGPAAWLPLDNLRDCLP